MTTRVEDRLYDALGTEWGGSTGPPLAQSTLYLPDRDDGDAEKVAMVTDDGFTVMLGYPEEWAFSLGRREARRFAFWYLGVWAREWFGLRRWAWYRLLSRRIGRVRERGEYRP